MMMRIRLAIIFAMCSFVVKGEIWPFHSLVDLCLRSDQIIDAKYYSSDGDNYTFTYKDLKKASSKLDTFNYFGVSHTIQFYDFDQGVNFENADRVIFFLIQAKSGDVYPMYSGYRIVKDNKLYTPYRRMNPGPYSFRLDSSLNAKEFSKALEKTIKKTSKFKSIFESKSISKQRKYYRKWLKKNSDELVKELPISLSNNGAWGMLHWLFRGHQKPSDISFEEFKSFLIKNSIIKKE